MAELYFDNLHKQLYAYEFSTENTPGTNEDQIELGLSDLSELPGQSTWYIRSILFKATGYASLAGTTPHSILSFNGGVVSRDISSTSYPSPKSLQDVAGWPLKGVYTEMLVENTPQGNRYSYQKLWKPSKNLTLNREQDILFNIRSFFGADLTTRMLIFVHAERGE